MTTHSFSATERTKVQRNPKRAVYDREVILQVLDEAMLYLHGSNQNRMYSQIAEGAMACISVTILDGLVLARSGLHHAMNYRSVVLFAKGQKVQCEEEKRSALQALVEQIVQGRWNDSRQPTEQELNATTVLVFPIEEASAKVRNGPPIDDDRDRELPIWAGVIPIQLYACGPITDTAGLHVPVPGYVAGYSKLRKQSSPG